MVESCTRPYIKPSTTATNTGEAKKESLIEHCDVFLFSKQYCCVLNAVLVIDILYRHTVPKFIVLFSKGLGMQINKTDRGLI